MSAELLILSIVLVIQTLVLIVMAFALVKASRKVSETTAQVQKSTDELNQTIQALRPRLVDIVTGVNDFVKSCQPVGEQLVDISMNIKDIIESAKETSADVSDLIKETSYSAKQQVTRIDNALTTTVKRMELITHTVTESLLNPLAEISAFLVGVRTALRYLRGDRPSKYARQDQDRDDMYI